LESLKSMKIFLIKEEQKLILSENKEKSNPKIIIENNNTFILKLENIKVDRFEAINVNQEQHLKVDLKSTFDPYR